MSSIYKFAKTSGIFFVGSVLSKAIVFLLLPVYTKYISPNSYGYYDLSITYITVVTSMLFFDIWSSVMRYMYESKNRKYKYKSVLSGLTIFMASTFMYGIVTVILLLTTHIQCLGLILLLGITDNIATMYSFICRGFGKNIDFAVSGIINTVAEAGLNIILIVGLHWNFSSLYIASIAGNVLQILFLEYKVKLLTNIKFGMFDAELTAKMFKYTLPLCLNSVSYWLLTSYNRIAINQVMGNSANGIYAIGNKFGGIIALVTTCFTYAWQDISFSRDIDDSSNGKYYSKACKMYLSFLGVGVALLIPACNIIFPFMINKSYATALTTIPLFLLTAVISAYSTFIGNIFYAIKRTKVIFTSMIISCILNLLICYPLIHLWGLNGANLAILLSFLINILIRAVILNKLIGFKTNYKAIVFLCVWITISITVYIKGNTLINLLWLVLCSTIALYIYKDLMQGILQGILKRGKKLNG